MTTFEAPEVDDDYEPNLGECDYALGIGSCTFGCYEEPACQTDCPAGGWPKVDRAPYAEFLLAARRVQYRTQNWVGWQSVRRLLERTEGRAGYEGRQG